LDDRRSDITFSTIQESRYAYTSVRRQRLQQTRVPESSQPQHGSASSDLHTDATDWDSDSPDADAATVNMNDASAMDGIYILVCEDFETCMLSKCLQHLIACSVAYLASICDVV